MKDTQLKPSPVTLMPKSKPGIKKEKMAAKKMKESKAPILKLSKGKKNEGQKVKTPDKKPKLNKDNKEPAAKRKRGRPRNDDKTPITKKVKEPKKFSKKCEDSKAVTGRKRKFSQNAVIKSEKDLINPPSKKPKINDINCNNVNGNIKLPPTPIHKSIQKECPSVAEHAISNSVNSNGTLPCKKPPVLSSSKPIGSILKKATFNPTPKSTFSPPPKSTFSPTSKSTFSSLSKPTFSPPSKGNFSPASKATFSPTHKTTFSPTPKSTFSPTPKSTLSPTPKATLSPSSKCTPNSTSKATVSPTPKTALSSPKKEMLNGNSWPKVFKVPPSKNSKNVSKKEAETTTQSKTEESNKTGKGKDQGKGIKEEKVNDVIPPFREPFKSHPQRMASLDAMAKMHVICSTDRKPPEHHPKPAPAVTPTACSQPFGHQKSLTQCHERIHFDLKKEGKDLKRNFVHKQINYVKEKQQVLISHSVEQSAVLEREQQSKTAASKPQNDKEKKKKVVTPQKNCAGSADSGKNVKLKQNASSNHLKLMQPVPPKEEKPKVPKNKEADKKCAKAPNKVATKAVKKLVKEKQDTKGVNNSNNKKPKKVEQTKSEVKVKETIRMQKTCTYQSVTTVNSHGATNSSVVPVSHVGMTTNYSKTKKTVVTDEECKNKINYSSGSVINNSYCLTSESPCNIGSPSDCCKFHTHPQIIPYAHVQTCSIGHGLNRTSDSSSSSSSHCDGSFSVHRFGHQPPVIFSPSTTECGCCCSGSLVQNVHDSCLLRKSIVAYPHHPPHHTHLSASAFSPEALCTDYRPNNTALDAPRHHAQHFSLSSPPHSRVSCCACCELHRESNQHHHQSAGNCLQYLSSPKNSASLVPCEQSPLDLSLASSSNTGVDSELPLPQGHCPSPLCCRELLLLRTSTPHGFQHTKFPPNKSCCRCSKPVACETQKSEAVQPVQCSNKSVIKIAQPHQSVDHLTLLASPVGQGSVPPVASTSGVTNKSVPRIITDNFVTAKQEKSVSPKQSSKPSLVSKKRQFAHGWSWNGKPRERLIALTNDSVPCPRMCYPSVQHKEGDTINEKDCVLLKSGPKDTDLPYVAKVAAFWENPEDGEMMMSLLWYYRPEHTDQGRKPGQMEDEVFASRHKDVNSVACIEDKCYVLTYNEYCRYRANLTMEDDLLSKSSMLVPELPDGYPRKDRLPNDIVSSDIVFFCRHVYDFRQKRILKNPT